MIIGAFSSGGFFVIIDEKGFEKIKIFKYFINSGDLVILRDLQRFLNSDGTISVIRD